MEVFILYFFISGLIYASWLYDTSDKWWINAIYIVFGLVNGCYAAPILIGRVIRQFYKD